MPPSTSTRVMCPPRAGMNSCTSAVWSRPRSMRPSSTARAQILGRVEAHDAGAAAADVGLDDDREAQALGRRRRLVGMVDDARRAGTAGRATSAATAAAPSTSRRGRRARPLTTRTPSCSRCAEVVERVEDAVAAAAQVRRRAHAVEDQAVTGGRRRWWRRSDGAPASSALVRRAAAVQLGEERPEPVRVLVVDADRFISLCAHGVLVSGCWPFGRRT